LFSTATFIMLSSITNLAWMPVAFLCSQVSSMMGFSAAADDSPACAALFEQTKHQAKEFILDTEWAITSAIEDHTAAFRQGLLGFIMTLLTPVWIILFLATVLVVGEQLKKQLKKRLINLVKAILEILIPAIWSALVSIFETVCSAVQATFQVAREHLKWLGRLAGIIAVCFWVSFYPSAGILSLWFVWWIPYVLPWIVCISLSCAFAGAIWGRLMSTNEMLGRMPRFATPIAPEHYIHVILRTDPPELKDGLRKAFAWLRPRANDISQRFFGFDLIGAPAINTSATSPMSATSTTSNISDISNTGSGSNLGVPGSFTKSVNSTINDLANASPGRTYGLPVDFYNFEDSFSTNATSTPVTAIPARNTVNTDNTPVTVIPPRNNINARNASTTNNPVTVSGPHNNASTPVTSIPARNNVHTRNRVTRTITNTVPSLVTVNKTITPIKIVVNTPPSTPPATPSLSVPPMPGTPGTVRNCRSCKCPTRSWRSTSGW
jgi:hypothetical protein